MQPPPPGIADYRWLVSESGQGWLSKCQGQPAPLPELARQLRRHLTPVQTQLLLTQLQLQDRAASRFRQRNHMWFTDRALQQATDELLADYKSLRFPADQAVIDLGCGVGGDLLAIAERGPALGVDLDPIMALLATANLQRYGPVAAWVAQGDVTKLSIHRHVAVHLDPDRRPDDQRSVRIQHHEPGPELIRRLSGHPAGLALKLAPATDPTDPLLQDAELEWVGHHRQCQQLIAWYGPLARFPRQRVATVLDPDGQSHSLVSDDEPSLALTATIGRYIVEPVACVLAAGLAGEVATRLQAAAITARGGYLTADVATPTAWTTCFEVLDVMPFRLKRVKSWLKARNVGCLEIKKRGVTIDPAQLRRQLQLAGNDAATLILTQQGPRSVAILARRVPASDRIDEATILD